RAAAARDLCIVDAGLRTTSRQVAIVDAVRDHGRAARSQRVALVSDRPDGKLDVLVGIFDGLDRLTRGNATDDRDTHHARLGLFAAARDADQLQAARNLAVTADATLTLQDLEVVVHHGRGRDPDLIANLADARRVAPLVHVGLDVLQDVLLALRKLARHSPLLGGGAALLVRALRVSDSPDSVEQPFDGSLTIAGECVNLGCQRSAISHQQSAISGFGV